VNPLPADAAARNSPTPTTSATGAGPVSAAAATGATGAIAAGYVFPREKMPAHTVPSTPIPASLRINESLKGDPARGEQAFVSCVGCHAIRGNPMALGIVGPNLTHVATRHTIAGGLFPNDTRHLTAWIKNARAMKPGIIMPTLGLNETDPTTKAKVTAGGLTDQQIADIVAYLQALK
jgi:cytochrome c oxidase subunit 2